MLSESVSFQAAAEETDSFLLPLLETPLFFEGPASFDVEKMLLILTAFFCPYLFVHVHAVRITYIPPRVGRIDRSAVTID